MVGFCELLILKHPYSSCDLYTCLHSQKDLCGLGNMLHECLCPSTFPKTVIYCRRKEMTFKIFPIYVKQPKRSNTLPFFMQVWLMTPRQQFTLSFSQSTSQIIMLSCCYSCFGMVSFSTIGRAQASPRGSVLLLIHEYCMQLAHTRPQIPCVRSIDVGI